MATPMAIDELTRLRAEIDTLREENRQLRDALAGFTVQRPWGLNQGEAKTLAMLVRANGFIVRRDRLQLAGSPRTREELEDPERLLYVRIAATRKKLARAGAPVDIRTAKAQGYFLVGDIEAARRALGLQQEIP